MLFGKYSRLPFLYEAEKGKDGDPPPDDDPSKGKKKDKAPQTWDAYVESLPDEIKVLYDTHTKGLKSALDVERTTNKENAAKLKRLEELEAEEKKRQEEQMTEKDRLEAQIADGQRQLAELQAKHEQDVAEYTSERIKSAVMLAATAKGFADPQDAYELADISEIEIDEDGKIGGVEEALKKLSDAKPYLLDKSKKGDGLGNDTRRGRKSSSPPPEDLKVPRVRL